VATGADLKCISGFSSSNYLEQPYNADLNFGVDDFSVSFWFNKTSNSTGTHQRWINSVQATGYARWEVYSDSESGNARFYTRNDNSATYVDIPTGMYALNVWNHFVCKRVGSAMSMSLNGVLVSSTYGGSIRDLTKNGTGTFAIGDAPSWDSGHPFAGSIALWRVSATAPTAEQIKEIYEAEKPLFQENAKCTLGTYPSDSSSVTAMDYDDSTDLLHVGTSNGRSTFKGLRRVEQTTPNTTEIAAQGGLIVEETD
jgi:hypothetical protein